MEKFLRLKRRNRRMMESRGKTLRGYFSSLDTSSRYRWITAIAVLYWGGLYVGLLLIGLSAAQAFIASPASKIEGLTWFGLGAALVWFGLPLYFPFRHPALRLASISQPGIFKLIKQVSSELQEPSPEGIELAPEADIYLAEIPIIAPVWMRRRLVVGLPLMQTLGAQHIQALAAVELAAFSNSADRLKSWIYRQWRWILLVSRRRKNYFGRLALFRWYGRIFLNLAAPIAHEQETAADRRAANWAGANILATALRSRSGTAAAYQAFLEHEFVPVVDAGFKPPVLEGFSRFLQSEMVQGAVQQVIISESNRVSRGKLDPLPPLGWRLEGLQGIAEKTEQDDNRSALRLLENPHELEDQLLERWIQPKQTARWKPIQWESTGVEVFLPIWQRTLGNYAGALKGVRPEELGAFLQSPDRLWVQVKKANPTPLSKQELREGVLRVCAIAMTVALVRNGWQVEVPLGQAILLSRGGDTLRPFELIASLAAGKIDTFSWNRFIRVAGIAGTDLGESG